MNIEDYRDFCLSVKGAEECFPFGDDVLVYKVMGKMFTYAGLTPENGRVIANMKCSTERSPLLMDEFDGVFFGPYSDKRYWITVSLDSDVPDGLIRELILHAVDEVIMKLPKKKQAEYMEMKHFKDEKVKR